MLPEGPSGATGTMAMLVSVASVYLGRGNLGLQQESAPSSGHHSSIQSRSQHSAANCRSQHKCTLFMKHKLHVGQRLQRGHKRQDRQTAKRFTSHMRCLPCKLHYNVMHVDYMHHIPCRHHSFKPETGHHHNAHLDHYQEEHDGDHKECCHHCIEARSLLFK